MGDDRDFERLFAEFGFVLRWLVGSYESDVGWWDDLAQEIAIAFWRVLLRFCGECFLRTFVYWIAHNRALTHVWRCGWAWMVEVAEVEHVVDLAESLESCVACGQRREWLDVAIRTLPIVYCQVLTLALEDLSHAEIGGVFGICENAVAVRLTRACQVLREALGVSS